MTQPTASSAGLSGTTISSSISMASRAIGARPRSARPVQGRRRSSPSTCMSPARSAFPTIPMLAHFTYLKSIAQGTPKMTIPSPSMLYYRMGREMFTNGAYPDMEEYYRDMGDSLSQRLSRRSPTPAAAISSSTTSPSPISAIPSSGRCWPTGAMIRNDQLKRNIGMINAAIAESPSRHARSPCTSAAAISGPPSSPRAAMSRWPTPCSTASNVDGYFMEWDTDRAGGFEPLRFLPKGKTVVLGLITSKTGGIEKKDDLKRRIDEAAKYAPDRAALPFARNADLPRPRRAIRSPRTNSGGSSSWPLKRRARSGTRRRPARLRPMRSKVLIRRLFRLPTRRSLSYDV